MPRAAITGTGFWVPDQVVTNANLAAMMDTSDAWIVERSGIRERRWLRVGPDGYTEVSGAEMGARAARMAIEDAGLEPGDVDLVLYATVNPDCCFPGNGVFVEDLLGLATTGAMDIRNQCTGFVYGLAAPDGFIQAGTARTVLLIGSEIHSTALDKTTRGRDIAVLFGDGAGAVVVQATDEAARGVVASVLHSQGRHARELWAEIPVGNLQERWTDAMLAEARQYPRMNGSMVFKHATRRFCEAVTEVLAKGGATIDDVALVVPHQANQRITDAVGERLGL
ncbi:MAG: 3-oxoacyl-ACP synthase III family protein, partial [Candidatus Krumholzibacteriia bacterium]